MLGVCLLTILHLTSCFFTRDKTNGFSEVYKYLELSLRNTQ